MFFKQWIRYFQRGIAKQILKMKDSFKFCLDQKLPEAKLISSLIMEGSMNWSLFTKNLRVLVECRLQPLWFGRLTFLLQATCFMTPCFTFL